MKKVPSPAPLSSKTFINLFPMNYQGTYSVAAMTALMVIFFFIIYPTKTIDKNIKVGYNNSG